MSNRTNLDRAYFSVIESCEKAVKLANMIASNATYKEAIQTATDPLIMDCCKEAYRFLRTLEDILNCQEYANVKFFEKKSDELRKEAGHEQSY